MEPTDLACREVFHETQDFRWNETPERGEKDRSFFGKEQGFRTGSRMRVNSEIIKRKETNKRLLKASESSPTPPASTALN
jgi:hypothetical protein